VEAVLPVQRVQHGVLADRQPVRPLQRALQPVLDAGVQRGQRPPALGARLGGLLRQ
jgi:hypothetical protein